MAITSYQTVKLGRGKHSSPDEGACVMELASMLAGEPFSDEPISVCPVIGSFLRAYNDSIDDERRQDLYTYAAKVVGSRGSAQVERARAERLSAWVTQLRKRSCTRLRVPRWLRVLNRLSAVDKVGYTVVGAIARHDDQTHAEVLALIDELLTIRDAVTEMPTPAPRPHRTAAPPSLILR